MTEKVWKTKMGTKNTGNKYKTVINMVGINSIILIITLNINDLNTIIKSQSISKNKTQLCVISKKPTLNIKTHMD